MLKVIPTDHPEVLIFEPRVFGDARGHFFESWNQRSFNQAVGHEVTFVQDNQSRSQRGVLRGLHFQRAPHAQGKLVRVTLGAVFDVAVDIRPESPHFGRWVGVELSADNHRQLWIPPGFAHGFLTLSDSAEFLYKTTDYYAPHFEGAVRWDDPTINIKWPQCGVSELLISEKDTHAPTLESVTKETNQTYLKIQKKQNILIKKILRSKKLTAMLVASSAKRNATSMENHQDKVETEIFQPEPINHSELDSIIGELNNESKVHIEQDTAFPKISVFNLKNTTIIGKSSLLINDKSIIHHDLFKIKTHLLGDELKKSISIDPDKKIIRIITSSFGSQKIDCAVSFNDYVAINYAHWLTEVLPKIVIFEKKMHLPNVPYLVDDDLHHNIYQSINLVTNKDRKIYIVPDAQKVFVSSLFHVSPVGYIPFSSRGNPEKNHSHGIFSSQAIKLMTSSIKYAIGEPHDKHPKKIYIKRNSTYRNLLNQNDIERKLFESGFSIIEPERMTFATQAQVFSNADIIIGPTGAALANIIFAKKSAKIAVLIADHPDMPYFYWINMAACVDQKITYIIGEPLNPKDGIHSDFYISTKKIDDLLGRWRDIF